MKKFRNYAYGLFILSIMPSVALSQKKTDKDSIPPTKMYNLPAVTVTTTRAVERQSPVPFTEITRADLQEKHTAFDIATLLASTPSVYYYSENGNNIGYTNIRVRGFDQRRVAVMINGVPQNDPSDHNVYWINFPDIASNLQSVQVQRGAGLMNYGSATIGGSINMITANYADKRFITISQGYGFQEFGANGTKYVPTVSKYSFEAASGLIDKYALYGRVSRINSAGYRDKSWAELESFFLSAARFDDNHTLQVNVFGGPIADGLAYVGLPKSFMSDPVLRRSNFNYWEYNSDSLASGKQILGFNSPTRQQEIENFSQPHYEILSDWKISDNLSLKTTVFYYTGDGFFDFDASWANNSLLLLTPKYGFPDSISVSGTLFKAFVGNRHGGIVPRLLWKHDQGELSVGGEFRLHRSQHWGKIEFAEGLPAFYNPEFRVYEYNGERDIFSLFAREQYYIRPNVLFNIEGQIVHHRYTIADEKNGGNYTTYRTVNGIIGQNGGDIFTVNYLFFNPRVGVHWNIDDQWSSFFSVALTSREPRMNNLYNASERWSSGALPLFQRNNAGEFDFSRPLVKPERMLDIEMGASLSASTIKGNITAYWMEFTNELVKSGQLDIFGAPRDGNAPRTRHVGLEADIATVLFSTDNSALTIGGNANVSTNTIIDMTYFMRTVNDSVRGISLNGNSIAGFPDVLAGLFAQYRLGHLSWAVTMRHVSGIRTDNFGDQIADIRSINPSAVSYLDNRVDAYTVFNTDLSYDIPEFLSFQSLRLRLQINNIANTLYAAGGEGGQFFPAAERNMYMGIDLNL